AVALYRRAMPLAATLRDVNRDELKTKLDYAVTRAGFRGQVEKLEALLKADPNDQEARSELVRLYVVELDNPAQAAKRLDLSRDSLSARFVLLAGMSPESLPRRALPEVGRWYHGLAEKSSAQGRLIALMRAKTYFERYLASEEPGDQRLEVATALDQVDAVLAKAAAASAKLTVVALKDFQADLGRRFPPEANLAAQGDARASGHWGNRLPENVFGGRRTGDAWSLNGPKGWFLARWNSPVRGRYILLFARSGTGSGDAWGEAAITINDTRPQRVEGMESDRVLIVDLGMMVPVTSVRLDIKGTTYPGLAAVEIHPDGPRAKAAAAPATEPAPEAEPAPF
ncbi:MAG: hypothetical protein IMZ66_07495, partial [Planctomycetes bacterium]|nr:hypothetical protein [Planctomycetota bacterium]